MSAFPGCQKSRWKMLHRTETALPQVSERLASGPPDWTNT
jgi:hypothetical protein